MPEEEESDLYWMLFRRYSGLLVFLVIVGFMNLLVLFIDAPTLRSMVFFINESLVLIFTISILYFVGTILRILPFPLNLPAPVFFATASIFLVVFLINVFLLVDTILGVQLFQQARGLFRVVLWIVFAGVLLVGYIHLLSPLLRGGDRKQLSLSWCNPRKDTSPEERGKITWEDVHREIRYAVYDVVRRFRGEINKKGNR